jgi:NADH dehydrogenase
VTDRPHVVIVGGGFAGLLAAKGLRHAPVRVTIIDRNNHHVFQPLLYQVASAAVEAGEIARPIRSVLRHQKNTSVVLGDVTRIDPASRTVSLADGASFTWDYLVMAPGARHSYFKHPEWEILAPGLKSVEDAFEIRTRILLAFERAERAPTAEERHRHLTFVVVGGGPTGVEVAGAIAEIARYALKRDFRNIDPRHASILLLEGGPRILPAYPEILSEKARESLRRLGVDVPYRGTGDVDRARIGYGGRLENPHGYSGLGRRQRRESAARHARRAARRGGAGDRDAGMHRAGSTRHLRRR